MAPLDSHGLNILLIDVSAVYWPMWHASAVPDGIQSRESTIRRCRRLAEGYDRVAICVDAGDSGRTAVYPGYKANREPHPAPAVEQLRQAIEYLSHDGFHVLRGDGFEADDTIATVCDHFAGSVHRITIACADKDLLQLVGGNVTAWSLSTDTRLGSDEVQAKLGVPPNLVPDLLALIGDKADNIPGCPGIGPKLAAEYVSTYGALENVIEAAKRQEINGKRGEAIVEYRVALPQARQLIRLRFDSPINPEILMQEPERDEQPHPPSDEPPDAAPNDEPIDVQAVEKTTEPGKDLIRAAPFSMQLEPQTMKQAHWVASSAVRSRLFNGYGTPEAALMCMLAGREMGLGAVASLRGFHVIKGRLCLSAQLMAGVVLRSGLAEYFEPILAECNEKQATWATKRKGSPREQKITFRIEDAKQAGLSFGADSNWSKYPKTMLRWRACADLARAVYPDIVGNVYTEADGMEE